MQRLLGVGLVACAALLALPGAARAGDDERLTRAQYVEQATEHCDELAAASAELQKAQAPGATGKRVAKYLRRAATGLERLVDGFDGLAAPPKLADDNEELVDVLDSYADGLDALADRVKRGQTFEVALQRNQDLVTRLNSIAGRATGLVTRLGLTGCLLPT